MSTTSSLDKKRLRLRSWRGFSSVAETENNGSISGDDLPIFVEFDKALVTSSPISRVGTTWLISYGGLGAWRRSLDRRSCKTFSEPVAKPALYFGSGPSRRAPNLHWRRKHSPTRQCVDRRAANARDLFDGGQTNEKIGFGLHGYTSDADGGLTLLPNIGSRPRIPQFPRVCTG